MQFWPVVLLAGIIAVLFAAWLARDVLSQDRGTKAMQEVAGLIFEGAMAFLNRQYRTISVFAIVAAVIIGVLIGALANDPGHGIRTAIAFLVGAFFGCFLAAAIPKDYGFRRRPQEPQSSLSSQRRHPPGAVGFRSPVSAAS